MARSKLGRTYSVWLKAWQKAGSPKWPEHVKFVAIHWTDAALTDDEAHGSVDALASGHLVDANEKEITVSLEVFADRDARTKLSIPAGMVNRVMDIATIRAFDKV